MTPDRREVRDVVVRAVEARWPEIAHDATPTVDAGVDRSRPLITEAEVLAAHRAGGPLCIRPGAIVTPLARDALTRYRVEVVETVRPKAEPANPTCSRGRVAIAGDHGGFELKRALIAFLENEAGIGCEELGCNSADPVDYPDFAAKVARLVAQGQVCRGIVIDGAGIGSAMAANKVRGVRAAHCSNVVEARNAREHNDANVLTLGGRVIGIELAKAITAVFLKTDFGGGRHQARIDKIMKLES